VEDARATSETGSLAKEELLEILTKLLDSGVADMRFLLQLNERCLEQLIVAVRMRLEKAA
jgi:hypothetical protein